MFNVIHGEELAPIEKVGGAILASLRAGMFFGVIGILLLLAPVDYLQTSVMERSKTCMFFVNMDVAIYSKMTNLFGVPKKVTKEEVLRDMLASDKG